MSLEFKYRRWGKIVVEMSLLLAQPSPGAEPVAMILQSVAGYAIKINFPTKDAAIAYAKQHGIKTQVTHYGY